MRSRFFARWSVLALAVAALLAGLVVWRRSHRADMPVVLLRTPEGGIQPQTVTADDGTVHLVFFTGDPKAGDVLYARRRPSDAAFSRAMRVNSRPGTAVATGTIRGAMLAVGPRGRVHVAWNGAAPLEAGKPATVPFWYARMNEDGSAFEAQRNAITWAYGLDGGGDVVADGHGNVFLIWHAGEHGKSESERGVFLARSSDGGATFARERRISPTTTGVCGCCGLRAHVDRAGNVAVVFRDAGDGTHRNTDLLLSTDGGETFSFETLHSWEVNACPMSSASISEDARGLVVAWQTADQVYFAHVDPASRRPGPREPAPFPGAARKHPLLLNGRDTSLLLAWTESTGWGKGGSLHWQRYDDAGRPVGAVASVDGVPTWSKATGYTDRDGRFVLMY